MELPKPVGIALVLCDAVYTEPTGKRALVGMFDRIHATRFPALHPRMSVYISATDFRPNTQCVFEIVHGETDEKIVEARGPIPQAVGPTAICDFLFELQNVVFPESGTYFARFLGNGQVILQRPVDVVAPKKEK
jgi:hypothetical protein